MNRKLTILLAAIGAILPMIIVVTTSAHNAGWDIPSPGRPLPAIVIDGNDVDWPAGPAGPYSFSMLDYGMADPLTGPLSATVRALHKSDGIYLIATITDAQENLANDAIQIRFDINHNGALEAADWGVEIRRNGNTFWGPATAAAATWAAAPAGTGAATNAGGTWKAELRLPKNPTPPFGGFPINLNQALGIHLEIFDADTDPLLGDNTATYTQWPQPTIADEAGLNTIFDMTPNKWGNYIFDPTSTFANVAVTDVRRGGGVGPSDYYRISKSQLNTFQVTVNNSGTAALADATGVRLNLYIGAVGIGEPFHRLDQTATIDGDCGAPWNPNAALPQDQVCSAGTSLIDIENIVNNQELVKVPFGKYTVKNNVNRVGGSAITVNGGATPTTNVVTWDTTAGQDSKFTVMTVDGMTYDRNHSCMKAEAIVPNDPNLSDNTRQVNMDFVCVPGGGSGDNFMLGLGAGAFANYNPAIGKDMFLHVVRKNMNPQAGWNFKLSDPRGQVKQVKDNLFVAQLKGPQTIGAVLNLVAPRAETLGRTLKENLLVPPKAGGRQANVPIPSGAAPIYVKVNAGSTLLVANFAFHMTADTQFVDVDGNRPLLPPNGPAGLSNEFLQKALNEVAQFKLLLSPRSPLGSLVGSFDNFKTSFLIGEGAQLKVPAGATHLALGINDAIGLYGDNTGTGFRVKVIERAPGTIVSNEKDEGFSIIPTAHAQQSTDPRPVIPLPEVMPTLCLNGYEKTDNVRDVAGKKRELFRFIGNVCWGVLNVFPPDRTEKPDQGDPFQDGGPKRGCGGAKRGGTILFPLAFAAVGIGVIGRFARRRR